MTHRAEQIMAAVETALSGLTTTGANVFRGREHAQHAAGNLPALLLQIQGDAPNNEGQTVGRAYWDLGVVVEIVVAAATDYEALLLQIRGEVTVALRSDYQLGLSFVQETVEGPAEAPQPTDQNGRHFSYPVHWTVTYSRSWDDPSV